MDVTDLVPWCPSLQWTCAFRRPNPLELGWLCATTATILHCWVLGRASLEGEAYRLCLYQHQSLYGANQVLQTCRRNKSNFHATAQQTMGIVFNLTWPQLRCQLERLRFAIARVSRFLRAGVLTKQEFAAPLIQKKCWWGGGLTPLGGLEETAGYKGYGLNMMVEILCAVLSGCHKVGPDVPNWRVDRGTPVDYGHCFICIDPTKLLPSGDFQKALTAYLSTMRQLPAGAERSVLVPGDPERAEETEVNKRGVRLNLQISVGLRNLAKSLNCAKALPQEIRDLPENATAPKHWGTVWKKRLAGFKKSVFACFYYAFASAAELESLVHRQVSQKQQQEATRSNIRQCQTVFDFHMSAQELTRR